MCSDNGGSKFPGLNQDIGVVEKSPNYPECNYLEGEASDLIGQVSNLEAAKIEIKASNQDDYYCEYTFQDQSLGLFKHPNPYFRLGGFHYPDAQFIFFPQKTPKAGELMESLRVLAEQYNKEGRPEGELEFVRYLVVVEEESGVLGDYAGESILQTINADLIQRYNSDIRKLDYRVVVEENGFHKVFLVEVAGFKLPPEHQTLKRPSLDLRHCPEWSWHQTGRKNIIEISGWEVKRLPNGNLEAIPNPETLQAIGDPINKHDLLPLEFENALVQSGYLQNRDPVRQLVDTRLRDGGVLGLECPVVEAIIAEIPNPEKNCLVWRIEQPLEEIGAREIPGGYLLESVPGERYRVIGATKDFSMEGLRAYFYKNFARPGYSLSVSTRELLKDEECKDIEVSLSYQKRAPKNETPRPLIDALLGFFPEGRRKKKLDKLQRLGGVHVVVTGRGGGGVTERLIEMIHEPKPVHSKKVVLVVDQSGSMLVNIEQVRQNLGRIMKELEESSHGDVQIGLVSYTDEQIKTRMPLRNKTSKIQIEELGRHLQDVVNDLGGSQEFRFDAIGKAANLFKSLGPPRPGEVREIIVLTDEGGEDGSEVDLKKDGLTKGAVERRLAQVGATLKTLYIYPLSSRGLGELDNSSIKMENPESFKNEIISLEIKNKILNVNNNHLIKNKISNDISYLKKKSKW